MRPVDKGVGPLNTNGQPVTFREHQDARGALITRLGEFCSYCEMHCDADLAVEHQYPKVASKYPQLALVWSNYLLACRNCNSTKGDDDPALTNPLWPDEHNTAYALTYGPGALVVPNPNLTQVEQDRAQALIDLVGLDVNPGITAQMSDRRWMNREFAWGKAVVSLQNLQNCNTPEMREQIAITAYFSGYWSVWMTVFSGEPEVRQLLIDGLPGTAKTCFENDGTCKPQVNLP